MELRISQFFNCLCMIILFKRTLSRSISGIDTFNMQNCTYFVARSFRFESSVGTSQCNARWESHPEEPQFPCLQYRTDNGEHCDQNWLAQQFPALYTVNGSKLEDWPGRIQDLDARPEVLRWRPPTDGSINYLRGFYVEMVGESVQSFGNKLCALIDLSGLAGRQDMAAVRNATFTLNTSAPGDYHVKVRPLPPAPLPYKVEPVGTDKPPIPMEYHPQFWNKSVTYRQLNSTSINMTIELKPQLEDVEDLWMEIIDANGDLVDSLAQYLPYPKPYYIINGFSEGNYTMWVRPVDKYTGDNTRCVCYFGTSDNRACQLCREMGKRIYVHHFEPYEEPTQDGPQAQAGVVAGAVTGTCLALVVAIATVVLGARRKRLSLAWFSAHVHRRSSHSVHNAPKQKLLFVFASDHTAHHEVVKAFIRLFESLDCFETSPANFKTFSSTSNSSFSSEESQDSLNVEQADSVIVIHSDWAKVLLEDMENQAIYSPDVPSRKDCQFISHIHQIKQNTSSSKKFVSVRFSYTSLSSVMTMPASRYFTIPSELNDLIMHLCVNNPTAVEVDEQSKVRLSEAIKACSIYQQQSVNWLVKKMFLTKSYISSDDPGIVTQRRPVYTKSIRSRSADTVSSCRGHCDHHTSLSKIRSCCDKQTKRSRAQSCDFSFIPPDSEDGEDQSLGNSLLESKFAAINERYEYFLNFKLNTDEDCVTIDGKSV